MDRSDRPSQWVTTVNGAAGAPIELIEAPMNNEEAIAPLDEELAKFRSEPYENLVTRMTTGSLDVERTAPRYKSQVQILVFGTTVGAATSESSVRSTTAGGAPRAGQSGLHQGA